jgi:ribosome-binding protein aMBF1 (putative translation factor)
MATGKANRPVQAKLIPAEHIFAEWHKDPMYREDYDALDEEFAIVEALMKARAQTGLSQSQIAERMNTTQSAVARLEAQAHRASLKTLRNYAKATDHRLRITLEPLP